MKQLITSLQVQRPKDGENDNREIFYMERGYNFYKYKFHYLHHEMNRLKSELKFTLHRCCELSLRAEFNANRPRDLDPIVKQRLNLTSSMNILLFVQIRRETSNL